MCVRDELEQVTSVGVSGVVRRSSSAIASLGTMLARLRADRGRGHAANVERRILQRFLVVRADGLGARDADALASAASSSPVAARICAVGVGQLDAVVVARDAHAAVVVLHAGEQRRQAHRRIRRVVAVVAAVQRRPRPVHDERRRA